MSKRFVVTGGAGFIGSHTVDLLLDEGHKVNIVDNFSGGHEKNIIHHKKNKNLRIFNLDITELDKENNAFKNADFVIHFAGIGDIVPSIEKPLDYMKVNVIGTVNVLECCKFHKVKKVIYAASSSCYGVADTPTDEDHQINTEYPYALSKFLGEQTLLHWGKVYRLPVVSIRIFNAYGPRVRTTGVYGAVFGVFLKQKLSKKPFTVVGDGTQKRDFIYVTDVARAFYNAATINTKEQIFNLGANSPESINKLVGLIGGDVVYIPERPGEPRVTWANNSLIKKELKWQPSVSFEKGVKIMLADIENWHDAPLWEPDTIKKATLKWFKYLGK